MPYKPAKPGIDIGLLALVTHAQRGQTLSRKDIAEVCGCSPAMIELIEKTALQKLQERAGRYPIADFANTTLETINP